MIAGGPRRGRAWLHGVAVVALGCAPTPVGEVGAGRPSTVAPGDRPGPGEGPRSNMVRADYAGSAACQRCHQQIFDKWSKSPMRRMTRLPGPGVAKGPFDGRTWKFKDDEAQLLTEGDRLFMRVRSRTSGDRLFRITRVIGGRHREDYAGVEVTGTGPDARPMGPPGDELVLPVSWIYRLETFRLKGYSVLVKERPGLHTGAVWNQTCIGCHNTLPHLLATLGEIHGPGAPGYQGEMVDRVMPRERRWTWSVGDDAAFEAALDAEIRSQGGELVVAADLAPGEARRRAVTRAAIDSTRRRLVGDHVIEVGVGCETCHGGSKEHVVDTGVLPSFEPRTPFLRAVGPGGRPATAAELENRTCARCHQVLFTRYEHTWEGGARRKGRPGGSTINSGEARDMLLGGCSRAMRCSTCHDPHGEDDPGALARLATPAGNGKCTPCHEAYQSAAAQRAHSHHDPKGAGGACIGCHMARKNMGLSYELTRYHRIGSPNDPARVLADRPIECALCHADKSTAALVSTMESWWGKSFDRGRLRDLYGDLDRPNLLATLERGKPHEQGAALAAAGEGGLRAAVPAIVEATGHAFPIVRPYAEEALERLTGRPCALDLDDEPERIVAAARACAAEARLLGRDRRVEIPDLHAGR